MAHPLVPLLILFIVLLVAAFVGWIVLNIVNDIADKTQKKLEKKHVTVSKDGVKVAIKQIKEEDYVQQTQNVLVKAWNLSTWPAYKSRFWNKQQPQSDTQAKTSGSSAR